MENTAVVNKIRLKVDPDRITVDDVIALEDGNVKTRAARDLIAKFVVDETEQYLSDEEARKVIGRLSLAQLMEVGKVLGTKIQEMMGQMVPTKTDSES